MWTIYFIYRILNDVRDFDQTVEVQSQKSNLPNVNL